MRYEADGSAGAGTGAGGVGAASPAAAAAPPSPPPQPLSQALQQSLHLLQQPHLLLKIASSRPLRQHFLQGSQHESHFGSQHFGSHLASQPQPLPQGSQQSLHLQLGLRHSKPRRPPNRSQQSLQHELQGSQHFVSQHFGSQHFGSQQTGLQAGLQHFGAQHLGWHESQQPQPSPPNMRSKSSKLNAWLHRPALTIIAPIIMCNFIEPRLLMRKEPIAFARRDAPRREAPPRPICGRKPGRDGPNGGCVGGTTPIRACTLAECLRGGAGRGCGPNA